MKVIKYRIMCEADYDTEEPASIERVLMDKEIRCASSNLDGNLEIVKREAYNGEYTLEDDGIPEPETPETEDSVWDELDAAYQEGYDEGYTEGVNSAYDQ